MATIVVLNRKGGVAKTSTCFHVSGTLAKAGKRVLLIDTDPQSNLTEGLLGCEGVEAERSVAALYGDDFVPDPAGLILSTPVPGVWILPGSEAMEDYNAPRPHESDRQTVLRDFVDEVKDRFDMILIDCPPNLQLCSWSAMVAADGVVVPMQVEDFGGQGLKKINRAMTLVRAEANPSLVMLGYLITLYNKGLAIHLAYAEQLRASYGPLVFEAVMPLATDYKVAVTAGVPVGILKPRSAAARATRAIADELLRRAAAGPQREVA